MLFGWSSSLLSIPGRAAATLLKSYFEWIKENLIKTESMIIQYYSLVCDFDLIARKGVYKSNQMTGENKRIWLV